MAPVRGEGVQLLWVTISLLALSTLIVATRLGVRKWRKRLGTDDWLMCLGLLLYAVTASLVIVCCFYGAGQYAKDLTESDIHHGIKIYYIAEFIYAASIVPIKTSICVALLHIVYAYRWCALAVWGVMITVAFTSVVFIIAIANLCHPITALWGETNGVCHPQLNSSISFYFSAVSIASDFTLATLPGVLLWNMQMKRRVKFFVAIMLSLGAFASCATIIRLRLLTLYDNPAEFMYSAGAIGLWSMVEEGIGIIAGSMPALRPLLDLPVFRRGSTNGSDSEQACINDKSYMPGISNQSGGKLVQVHSHSADVTLCSSSGEDGSSRHDVS